MASYGVTEQGFIPYPQTQILADLQAKAQTEEYFGEAQDVSIYDPIGQMLAIMSDALSQAWMGIEDSYYSLFPLTSSGINLDRCVMFGGLTRIPAQSATVQLVASGTNSTIIPIGGLTAQTQQRVQFINISSGIIESGISTIYAKAIVPGLAGIVAAGQINQLATPFAGISGISNPYASSGGKEIESDTALRTRFASRAAAGGSSLPAIQGALEQITGVTSAFVSENITEVTAGDGTPPHAIHVVIGGYALDTDIAQTIFDSKAAGIGTYGSYSATVIDTNGEPHIIYWDIPSQVSINVVVNISSNDLWSSGNVTLIKTAVIQTIGGVDTIDSISTQYTGGGIAADVYSWKIIGAFENIQGIENVTVFLAYAPTTPTTDTKEVITSAQYAWCEDSNITVNVT
jgi:uncharacterized phage protein gp47/JayE